MEDGHPYTHDVLEPQIDRHAVPVQIDRIDDLVVALFAQRHVEGQAPLIGVCAVVDHHVVEGVEVVC